MRVESLELKRCCFCLPLRRGLLVWVYLKLAVSLFAVVIATINILYAPPRVMMYVVWSLALIAALFEIAFSILFLIRAHQKNYMHLRIYYRYAIGLLVFEMLGLLAYIALEISFVLKSTIYFFFFYHFLVLTTCFFIGQIVLQGYFILLVRSEMMKLEGNTKFEFVNHTSQPACSAQTEEIRLGTSLETK